MSRHSSLNELRSLVRVLNPCDLFPCVEDAQKLAYLDLDACFGDLCDLTDCTYLKRIRKEAKPQADVPSVEILLGTWLDDALSDDDNISHDGVEAQAFESQENSIAMIMKQESANDDRVRKSCLEVSNVLVEAVRVPPAPALEVELELIPPNDLNLAEPLESQSNCSRDDDILVHDDYKADMDRIKQVVEVILNGGDVELQSVRAVLY